MDPAESIGDMQSLHFQSRGAGLPWYNDQIQQNDLASPHPTSQFCQRCGFSFCMCGQSLYVNGPATRPRTLPLYRAATDQQQIEATHESEGSYGMHPGLDAVNNTQQGAEMYGQNIGMQSASPQDTNSFYSFWPQLQPQNLQDPVAYSPPEPSSSEQQPPTRSSRSSITEESASPKGAPKKEVPARRQPQRRSTTKGNKKRASQVSRDGELDPKRRESLQRNREAATKCRQKKKDEDGRMIENFGILAQQNQQIREEHEELSAALRYLKERMLDHISRGECQCQAIKDWVLQQAQLASERTISEAPDVDKLLSFPVDKRPIDVRAKEQNRLLREQRGDDGEEDDMDMDMDMDLDLEDDFGAYELDM